MRVTDSVGNFVTGAFTPVLAMAIEFSVTSRRRVVAHAQERQQKLRPSSCGSLAVTGAAGLIHSELSSPYFRLARHPGTIRRKHIAGLASTIASRVGASKRGLGREWHRWRKGLFSPGMARSHDQRPMVASIERTTSGSSQPRALSPSQSRR